MKRWLSLMLNVLMIWIPMVLFAAMLAFGLVQRNAHLIIVGIIGVAVALGFWGVTRVVARNAAGRQAGRTGEQA